MFWNSIMGTSPSKDASKTIIVGANGCVGVATLESLLMRDECNLDVYAGIRNEEKFERHMLKVPTVYADMSNKSLLKKSLRGFHRAFIIVPSDKNRTALACNALEAAKAAGVKYILLLSITIADTNTIFGRQFKPIEDKAKSLGIPYTIIRLPLFLDNIFAHSDTVSQHNRVFDPRDPRRQYASVALEDVGSCAASILTNPSRHLNKTYNLVSQTFSMIDLSISMTKILRRQVKIREICFHRYRESLLESRIPEWQIDGLIEWLELDFDRRINENDKTKIQQITGKRPTSLDHFVAIHADRFGWGLNPDWD